MDAGDDDLAVVVDLGAGVDDMLPYVALVAGDVELDDVPGAVAVGELLMGEEVVKAEVLALVVDEVGPVS